MLHLPDPWGTVIARPGEGRTQKKKKVQRGVMLLPGSQQYVHNQFYLESIAAISYRQSRVIIVMSAPIHGVVAETMGG